MNKLNKFAMSALLIALAFVLSLIKLLHLPFGGSITMFSMLFIALPSYFFGVKYGFLASFIYSLLQLLVDPYVIHPMQLFLDYILPFTCFGVAGYFRNKKNGIYAGYVLGCVIRFLSSSLSGYIFFKEYAPEAWNPIVYTVAYNGSYIFTECVLTIIFISIKQINNLIEEYRVKWK